MTNQAAVPTVPLLINGEWVESTTTVWRDVVNPATQEVLARVPFATPDEVNAAIASAQRAFKTWRKTPIGARARIFLKLQQLIRENMADLAATLTMEQGKTLLDAEGDVFRGLEVGNTRPISAPCRWASMRRMWLAESTPIACCSRWACAPALRRSTSPP